MDGHPTKHLAATSDSGGYSQGIFHTVTEKHPLYSTIVYKTTYTPPHTPHSVRGLQTTAPTHCLGVPGSLCCIRWDCAQMSCPLLTPTSTSCSTKGTVAPLSPRLCQLNHPGVLLYNTMMSLLPAQSASLSSPRQRIPTDFHRRGAGNRVPSSRQ